MHLHGYLQTELYIVCMYAHMCVRIYMCLCMWTYVCVNIYYNILILLVCVEIIDFKWNIIFFFYIHYNNLFTHELFC